MVQQQFDRTFRLAERITGDSQEALQHKFGKARVLIRGDAGYLGCPNGRVSLRAAVNMIVRFCPNIDLGMEESDVTTEAAAIVLAVQPDADLRIVGSAFNADNYDAVLSIGPGKSGPHSTVIASDGWRALVSSTREISGLEEVSSNALGAIAAACLGVADVFKRLLRPRPGRAVLFDAESLHLLRYVNGEGHAPPLPMDLRLPLTLLVGAGAVGNAFTFALDELSRSGTRLSGALLVCDHDRMDFFGMNRHLLATFDDAAAKVPKVQIVAAALEHAGVVPLAHFGQIESLALGMRRGDFPTPPIVLCALDDNIPRHELQRLWPDVVLEGATGDTTVQISRHEYESGFGCLMCIHPIRKSTSSFTYEEEMARLTGLSPERIATSNELLTEAEIPTEGGKYRDILLSKVGKPICSVLSSIEALAEVPETVPPEPTVSFVSALAGCLLATEYLAYVAGIRSSLETMFQLDLLFPLRNALLQPVLPVESCMCQLRKMEIADYRRLVGHRS